MEKIKLSVLMTVYNEQEFIEYAINSCYPHIDHLVIVEGAYQQTIDLGKSPRSNDGTIETIHNIFSIGEISSRFSLNTPDGKTIEYVEANEHTDKDQRNIGLEIIKRLNPDGWLLIVDGDEIYEKKNLDMIKILCKKMEQSNQYAAYFRSLTFVNDFEHFCVQEFPRLFKITPNCKFTNDNFMCWDDKNTVWSYPFVIKYSQVAYHHYAFCKGIERFSTKQKWWENRFGKNFDYGWKVDDEGKIGDKNHTIREFKGNHPDIMNRHKLYKLKEI